MASSSGRKSGSSGRSTRRKRVVIGAQETVRVRYAKNQPQVETERKRTSTKRSAPASGAKKSSGARRAGERISSTKRNERERRQQTIRLKRTGVWVAAGVAVLGVVWAFMALVNAPVFDVGSVEVTGASHLSEDEVRQLAGVSPGVSLFAVDADEVSRRVAASPWVAEVEVDKAFPDTLKVGIRERVAAAIVDAGGTDLLVVSTDGRWLGTRSAEETGLVVIRDVGSVEATAGDKVDAPEILNALKLVAGVSDELMKRTVAISAPSIDRTLLLTDDEVEIFFGEATDVQRKDRIARELLAKYKDKVVYINVRVVESPTWRGIDTAP